MKFLILKDIQVDFGLLDHVYIKNRTNLYVLQRLPFQWCDTYVLQS